ncbi:hypothetical protein DI43_12260 [Geobacillus sp. CAMR12739]|nr:hypothetical protein DI43_12260 [Geobacillus sp. CAMR12739]
MKIEDERSRLRDELNAIVASANATAEEKMKRSTKLKNCKHCPKRSHVGDAHQIERRLMKTCSCAPMTTKCA